MSTVETLAAALAEVLQPLTDVLDGAEDEIASFVEELGWILPGPVPPALTGLSSSARGLDDALDALRERQADVADGTASEEQLLEALGEVLASVAAFATEIGRLPDHLRAQLPADYLARTRIADHIQERLFGHLLSLGIEESSFAAHAILFTLGFIEEIERAADPAIDQPEFTLRRVRWDRVPQLLSDPAGLIRELYGWGTPDLDARRLFNALQRLGIAALAPPEVVFPEPAFLATLVPGAVVDEEEGPEPQLLFTLADVGPLVLKLAITPLPKLAPSELQGLAVTLIASGVVDLEIPLTPTVAASLEAEIDLAPGLGVTLRPDGPPEVLANLDTGAPFTRGRIAARLRRAPPEGDPPARLISIPGGSRLEAREVGVAAGVEGTSAGGLDAFVEAGLVDGKLVITAAEADGFLAELLPEDGIAIDFDLGVGWSKRRGVYVSGGAGLETALALHASIGPLRLETLHLVIGVDEDGLRVELSVSGGATLGPLAASVERIGLALALGFSPGNLGPVDLAIQFKPPTGVGLVIDAGPITGGGHVSFDPPAGRYAGVLQLEIYGISVTAIGLIDTILPGGAEGFSFLIIISAEFTPIQLGFGFTLNGVGGLAGIHRTIITQALQDGVRSRSIDHILFPADPVAHAQRIISDLRSIFPPAPGRYVFGPMAILGWGTPTLVEIELGIVLEVPEPVRLVLLGQINALLPTKEAAVVELHIDVLGVLDFEQKTLAIDASLHDSRIAAFNLYGDMAFRLAWGGQPNFAFSLGGLHPAYQPPPDLPALRRLTVALGDGDNPRIGLQAYMAITSNTVQFGARAELYAAAGGFNVYGWLGFDVLVIFSPFSFRADLSAGVALRRGTTTIAGIWVHASLTGPTPWRAWGEACISILFFDVCVDFDATFGDRREDRLPPVDPWPLLEAAIEDPRNWSSRLPVHAHRVVSYLEPATATVLVDPLGSVELHQRVVPLNRPISKFGETTPANADRFFVSEVRAGDDVIDEPRMTEDFFAPAQFEQMSDAEKLSRPSFERMDAGIAIASDAVDGGPSIGVEIEYETIIVDDPFDGRRAPRYPLPRASQLAMLNAGAAARAPLRRAGSGKFAPTTIGSQVALRDEEFVIVSSVDLTIREDLGVGKSMGQALWRLREYLDAHPEEADQLEVVPRYEAEAR